MTGEPATRRYEVTFVLDAPGKSGDDLRDQWHRHGDAVVVVAGDGGWDCRVRTEDIGRVIESALDVGRPRRIRVTEMIGTNRSRDALGFEPRVEAAVAPVGVVAVVSGEGMVELFAELLAQGVVDGGPRMSPGIDDLVDVVEAVPAGRVIVLPNNRSLVSVAEELDALTTKFVSVVPTRSIQQGIAAMMGYSTGEESLEDAAQTMSAAASSIISAGIGRASRHARVEGCGEIRPGDWVGMLDGTPIVADRDVWTAMSTLLRRVMTAPIERVTVYAGSEADPAVSDRLAMWVSSQYPRTILDLRAGGQVDQPYLLSFE